MELMRKRSLREGFVFVGSGVMMYVKVMGNSTIVPDTLYFTVSQEKRGNDTVKDIF